MEGPTDRKTDYRKEPGGFAEQVPKVLRIGCAVVWSVPFGLLSLILYAAAYVELRAGDTTNGLSGLVFAVLVTGLALAPLLFAVRRRRNRATPATPGEAWRIGAAGNPPTLATTLTSGRAAFRKRAWFALLWNALAWPLAVGLTLAQEPASAAVWFVWMFPLAGLGLLGAAALPLLRQRRYGKSVFEMETYPAVTGSTLRGTIRTALKDRTLLETPLTVTLGCYERTDRRVHRDGRWERRVYVDEVWSQTKAVRGRAPAGAASFDIPVEFDVPPGLDASTFAARSHGTLWRLDVEAERPGLDYRVDFEVPILEPEALLEGGIVDAPPAGTPDEQAPARPPADRDVSPARAHDERPPAAPREHGLAPTPAPEVLVSEYGETPWLHRKAWQTPRITAERPSGTWGLVFAACLWLAMTAFGAYLYATGRGEGGSPGLFIGFGAAGLGVLALGLYRVARQRRYRHVVLELDALPGAVGGTLAGRVETDLSPSQAPETGFHVALTCYRRTQRRDSDGHRRVSETPLWRDEKRMRGVPYGDGKHLAVPLFFRIPPDLPESTPVAKPHCISWKVEISADVPGVDFDAAIEIPVFVVEGRSRARPAAAEPEPAPPGEGDGIPERTRAGGEANPYAGAEVRRQLEGPVSRGIRMETRAGGGLHAYFGMARHWSLALLLTVLALGSAVLVVGVGFAGGILLLVLLFFTGALGYGAWRYWTYASAVTVSDGRIVVRSGAFARKKTVLPAAALDAVEVRTRTDGRYDLHLVRSDLSPAEAAAMRRRRVDRARTILDVLRRVGLAGRRRRRDGTLEEHLKQAGALGDTIPAAEALDDRQEADWIAARIEAAARRQEVEES